MIEKIKEIINSKYNQQDTKGIFFSGYDKDKNMIISSWVMHTDKPLEKVTEMLYHGLIEKHSEILHIRCDVVETIQPVISMEEVEKIDMKKYGVCASTVDYSKSGVVLPWTIGIHNASEALSFIKKKHNLFGNINIYTFTTDKYFIE